MEIKLKGSSNGLEPRPAILRDGVFACSESSRRVIIGGMIKITFLGGAQEVTGANHLVEYSSPDSTQTGKLLIDCGMFQGTKTCEDQNHEPFGFSPKEIDVLFITHAHLDHIGRIPKLVKEGFKGKIISTPPTKDLAELSLVDSMGILKKEAEREKREPPYTEEEVRKAMEIWETSLYGETIHLAGVKAVFMEAGHILGSAMVELVFGRGESEKKVVFSGDLGNPPTPLLKDPYDLTDADYLIIESTYGSKEHEGREERKLKLERAIEDTIKSGGVLMIPAFSIERTQELLFELNDLVENGRINQVPIFLDSPLAIKATAIYKKYESYFNQEVKYVINSGDDIFKFPGLKFCLRTEESKAINNVEPPKVVIAGSGMSTGGRIVHHEKRYLPDANSTLLLMSYQAAGSLGRQIEDGAKWVTILGDKIPVNARVLEIKGYSSHPDVNGLFSLVEKNSDKLKKVFVVQGEPHSALFFAQKVKDYLGIEAAAPARGESATLE